MRQFSRAALILMFATGCSAAVDRGEDQAHQEDHVVYPTREVDVDMPVAPEDHHPCDDGDPCTDDTVGLPTHCAHAQIRGCENV